VAAGDVEREHSEVIALRAEDIRLRLTHGCYDIPAAVEEQLRCRRFGTIDDEPVLAGGWQAAEEGMSSRKIAAELELSVTTVVEECRGTSSEEGRRPYFSGTKLAWISSGASGTKTRCAYGL
jgi:hypothetical protein